MRMYRTLPLLHVEMYLVLPLPGGFSFGVRHFNSNIEVY